MLHTITVREISFQSERVGVPHFGCLVIGASDEQITVHCNIVDAAVQILAITMGRLEVMMNAPRICRLTNQQIHVTKEIAGDNLRVIKFRDTPQFHTRGMIPRGRRFVFSFLPPIARKVKRNL